MANATSKKTNPIVNIPPTKTSLVTLLIDKVVR